MMMTYRNATAENLAKVAATKDADGRVHIAPRMQRASFQALLRAGWLTYTTDGMSRRYVISAEGERVLAQHAETETNPFVGGHGLKAQETFRLLGTKHSDWFHPAVKWVRETREMAFEVMKRCPTCHGEKRVRFDAEGKVIPMPNSQTQPNEWQEYMRGVSSDRLHGRGGFRAWNGNCPTCMRHGRRGSTCTGEVFSHVEMRPVEMMVGYILWPKGVKHGQSRFASGSGRSLCRCEICGKGINKSGRVPVAHEKDGKALSMWVGEDCARKFTKVAKMAAPEKSENPQGLPSVLDENYVVGE